MFTQEELQLIMLAVHEHLDFIVSDESVTAKLVDLESKLETLTKK